MNGMLQDLRFGVRILRTHRQFTSAAIVLLVLGIGVTTAIFSVVNAVLLRPLPYQQPERLVAITSVFRPTSAPRFSPVVPLTDITEWRRRTDAFASMGGFAYTQLPVRIGNQSFSPVTALMDAQFLPTLGNPLLMGSFFDELVGTDTTAIVSHGFWVAAFGSDPAVIGRSIAIDGEAYVVRGVLAADFQFPRADASYFTKPIELMLLSASFPAFPPQSRQWFGIARLKPGVTIEQAQGELASVAESLSRTAGTADVWSARLTPLDEETARRSRQPLLIVLGISIVLLMIACTNLMNLFFSRGAARLREMSIRRAIGGSSVRLVRQLLAEALILALLGGGGGVMLAWFAIDAIVALSPLYLPVSGTVGLDGRVLSFTLFVCLASAVTAGIFPAMHLAAKTDEAVRSPGMRSSPSRRIAFVQRGLCAVQVALGMALLAAAGLLSHSLWRLSVVDPGFDSTGVLGFNLSVPSDHSRGERRNFYARALEEIRTIPGVERAGMISFLPPETRAGVFMGLAIEGVPPPERSAPARVVNTLISSVDYFATVRTPIVQGRDFGPQDNAEGRPVVIVNEALVRRYLPNQSAIGQRIGTQFDGLTPVREIIGIVRDAHDRGLAADAYPTAYIPFEQFSLPYAAIAFRTGLPRDAVIPVVRDRLHRLNASVPLTDVQSLDQRLSESLREPRFYTSLAASCALLAVIFVSFGLYGLVSYSVTRRTSEVGIRMAVGAQHTAILRMVLLQGLRLSAVGIALGLGLSLLLTRTLESLLYRVRPIDPLTLSVAAATVMLVTLVASFVPARRASRVNPITALRHE
jgi:putative ABC transport system permease protein